jgi:hypothetical protein
LLVNHFPWCKHVHQDLLPKTARKVLQFFTKFEFTQGDSWLLSGALGDQENAV